MYPASFGGIFSFFISLPKWIVWHLIRIFPVAATIDIDGRKCFSYLKDQFEHQVLESGPPLCTDMLKSHKLLFAEKADRAILSTDIIYSRIYNTEYTPEWKVKNTKNKHSAITPITTIHGYKGKQSYTHWKTFWGTLEIDIHMDGWGHTNEYMNGQLEIHKFIKVILK